MTSTTTKFSRSAGSAGQITGSTFATELADTRREIVSRSRKREPFMLLSGFEGANSSPARGYVYWPTLNARQELSAMSDHELRRRIKWLYANFGVARRIVRGLAKMLGIQTPQPVTPDDDWNELVFDHFVATAGSPLFYDRRGRFDYFTGQPVINRHRFKDGRMLGVFTESPGGGARMVFYDAQQIRTPGNLNREDLAGWEQGVLADRFDRPMFFGVQDGKEASRFAKVPARDAIYFSNWDSFGAIHGISVLAHAVSNMIDVVELRGLRKHGAKNAAQLGTVIEKDRAVVSAGGSSGLTGPLIYSTVEAPDGTPQDIKWELMTSQGVVPRLDPGERIKIVTDDRPTPNNLEFDRALIEDCILGVDLPPAALYFAAGLTGPGIRFNMEDIRRWILIEQKPQARYNHRYYTVWVSKELKAGRIPPTRHPWWRQVEMIGQPDMTIDRGKEGNLAVTRLDAGLTTWADEYALAGAYGKRKLREKVRETAWIKSEIAKASEEFGVELSLGEVIPRLAGKSSSSEERLSAVEQRNAERDRDRQEQEDEAE